MKENKEIYKYIARYVDDLAVVSNNPSYIIEELLEENTTLSLKDQDPSSITLGEFFPETMTEPSACCQQGTLKGYLTTMYACLV